jgi:LemA protein
MGVSVVNFIVILALIALALVAIIVIWSYNRLVTRRNRFINALSQIDVQLKRRYDLVPGLVESVRGYLTHEKSILEEIARLRAQPGPSLPRNPRSQKVAPTALIQNDLALSQAMSQFTAVIESYPNLKADKAIADLMDDLQSVENRVAFARQAYNDAVMDYNLTREMFPAVMFASTLGFKEAWFWWTDPQSRVKPTVGTF